MRRVLILLISILFGSALVQTARAQQYEPIRTARKVEKNPQGNVLNLPNYDNRLLHFGFFLAINYTRFKAAPSNFFNGQLNDTINPDTSSPFKRYPFSAINPKGAAGFTTGFIISMRLSDLWDIRLLPTVSFYQRSVEYTYSQIDSNFINARRLVVSSQLAQNTYSFIELPILFKYKSVRRDNMRMFVIGGIKPSLEVGAKKKELSDQVLRPNSRDIAVEYGFGIDLYYPLFKFSPEIRFAHGLSNMRVKDDNDFAKSLRRLTTHTVTLYLNFN